MHRFYITGGFRDDGSVVIGDVPLVKEGTDRMDALSRCGFTVWTEQEWVEAQARVALVPGWQTSGPT